MNHGTALYLRGTDPIKPGDSGVLTRNLHLAPFVLDPPPKLAKVRVLKVGVCGSDLSAACAKPNFSFVRRKLTKDGVIDGHEGGGIFEGVGPELLPYGSIKPGDRVVAIAMHGCGRCRGCIQGRPNRCRSKSILGFHQHGLMSPVCFLEPERLLPALPWLSDTALALVEPLSVVFNWAERAIAAMLQRGAPSNLDAIVSGPGIIGYLVAEVLRSLGLRVAIVGVAQDVEHRLSLAQQRGIHPIVVGGPNGTLKEQLAAGMKHSVDGGRFGDPMEDGAVDLFVECSGAPSALASAPEVTASGGTIGMVATYAGPVDGFEATLAVRGDLILVGVMGSAAPHYQQAMIALSRGQIDPQPYIKEFPGSQALDAFEAGMRQTVCKPVINWSAA